MEDEMSARFDIDSVEYDKNGDPIIPRIYLLVPRAYRKEFIRLMIDEVRTTPGEAMMSIFVRFFQQRRAEAMAVEAKSKLEKDAPPRRVPDYGPKPVVKDGQAGSQIAGGE